MVWGGICAKASDFGTVFHPQAATQQLLGHRDDLTRHLVQTEAGCRSYHLHSSLVAASAQGLKNTVHELVTERDNALAQTDYLVLTMGTAWHWYLLEGGELVANCQKQPARLFGKALSTPENIASSVAEVLARWPHLKLILTVSPVRHTRETLPGNAVSKSVLRLACHQLVEQFPDRCWYFPAYELVIDDLRDYRFFEADMIHPSQVAVDYVWAAFQQATMSPKLVQQVAEVTKAWRHQQHRPHQST